MPWFVGRRVVEPSLEELVPFIDWTFFFSAWELKGRFPAILDHPTYGAAARDLYDHAQATARRASSRSKRLTARGVYGFWPANTVGDDIVVYKDDARRRSWRGSTCCGSRSRSPTAGRIDRSPTSSRRRTRWRRTTSARSR